VLVNQETQVVSLIDTIDRINFAVPPNQEIPQGAFLPIEMSLVTSWRRTVMEKPETGKARLKLSGPDGQELSAEQGEAPVYEINLQDSSKSRGTIRFQGFPFVGSGVYWLIVQSQTQNRTWQDVANIPLEIFEGIP
jgi:hypothetical protein